MDKKILAEHQVLIFMIYELFESSIRHEYLSDIVLKTKYKDINSKSSFSRLVTKLKKAKILNEKTECDFKKRLYLNKPVLAYLKGVQTTKTSSVSLKTSTLIKSNFKARYFIEKYVEKHDDLDLKQIVELASKSCGNLLSLNDKHLLNRICKVFDNSLTEDAMERIINENDTERSVRKKQLQSLKAGPIARKEQAKLKADGKDVYEEFSGDPVLQPVSPKKNKKEKQKVISLQNLKKNNVYLSDIVIKDIDVKQPYYYSVSDKYRGRTDFYTHFDNLQTKQITLKFVHFCSAKELKTSKMLSLYNDVKAYTDSLTFKDVVTKRVVEFVNANRSRLIHYDSKTLSRILSTIEFDSHQVVKIVAELDVIFMNEINYKRVIKKLVKHKELKDQINLTSYKPSNDYKINFRHYNFYSMNEHDPD